MTSFGPQLIGETEKTLNALLGTLLDGTGLDERAWVTLRLAAQAGGADLPAFVEDRAHFRDAASLVAGLRDRGLIEGDALSAAGADLVGSLQERLARTTEPIWRDLPADDVAATERILNTLVARAREVLVSAR